MLSHWIASTELSAVTTSRIGLTYKEAVGKRATIFVSHAWKYTFVDVVDVIIRYVQGNTDYLWFDLFVNNQWKAGELPFEWWTNTFISSVQSIGHTLLVMLPLHSPICLTRAWCIFEIYSSICRENTKFSLGISQADISSALERVQSRDQLSAELASIVSFDTRLSECGKPEDRVRIHDVVSRLEGGFEEMNNKIENLLIKLLNEQLSQTYLMVQRYLIERKADRAVSTVWKSLIKVGTVLAHSLTHLLTLTHSYLLTHPPTHSLTHSYSLTHPLTYSLTHIHILALLGCFP